MSKFCISKIKWLKSVEKLENGGSLGPLRQNCPQTIRWIRQCYAAAAFEAAPHNRKLTTSDWNTRAAENVVAG